MTPMNVATHSTRAVQPCGCGCSDCKGDCCDLECLSRPNFFCGQVLTDDDLKALVDWTNAKVALQRFKTGWGVACGLEVSCWHTEKGSGVKVSEGYAVDCCGRDIVVCEPLTYEFKCEKPFDPCCKKKEEPPKPDPNQPAPNNDLKLGCIPVGELRAFELCLGYDEKHRAGKRPMVRSGCDSLSECEATRITETGKLYAKEIAEPCLPNQDDRADDYRKKLKGFIDELLKYRTPQQLRDWVGGKMHSFCFVEECLCELAEETKKSGPKNQRIPLESWYAYIIQDWRNHYLQCACDPCKSNVCDGDGVPLARVWVWDKKKDNCRICRVAYIDAYPPYRRFLGRDCWTSHPGCVDLSRYIWRDVEEVKAELHGLGFGVVEAEEIKNPNIFVQLGEAPEGVDLLCATPKDTVRIHSYMDHCNRQRVVLFARMP